MSTTDLKRKASAGILWTTLQNYSTTFISFVSGIVLARLLTPDDYACIGMLAIFMVLAEAFIDGGFGSALIQKKQPTPEDYSTVFWWNMVVSLLMYGTLFISAPAIARFYNLPVLSKILRVQGLILFVYAFNIVQRNQLRKNLKFKTLSIVTVITSLISIATTIFMAAKGFGVWALVTQNLITATIPALVFWFVVKWRPMFVFSKSSFKSLFSFGFYMFLSGILNRFANKFQGLLIGKFYPPATLGYFSKAQSTENTVSKSIWMVMNQVTYPLYATVQNDKQSMINIIKRLTGVISYLTFPLIALLCLVAKPLFLILYSEKWLESVPYFQALCIAGLAFCLQSINTQPISAIGKSKVTFKWALIKRLVGLSFVVVGMLVLGIKGLVAGIILDTWCSYFINISLVSKYIGYKWYHQLRELLPVVIVCLVAATLAFFAGRIIKNGLYLSGLIEIVVFLSVYLIWSIGFKPSSYLYLKDSIIPMVLKKRKHKQVSE